MSAICGVVRFDGAPVTVETMQAMMEPIAYWGPDGSGVWREGPVALGHHMLHTTPESLHETTPGSAQYRHRVFGLLVATPSPWPELPLSQGAPDVTFRYGSVPDALPHAAMRRPHFDATPTDVLVRHQNVGGCLVREGREVVMAPGAGFGEVAVRSWLFGSTFGALLHQRQVLPLHASAVEVDGDCVVIAGNTGSGKSTLAAAMIERGYRVLTDDIAAVSMPASQGPVEAGQGPTVQPGPRWIKVHEDGVGKLTGWTGASPISLEKENKRLAPLGDRFCPEPRPIRRVYVLLKASAPELTLTRLRGVEKVGVILRKTSRKRMLEGMGPSAGHMERCARLAAQTSITTVGRPEESCPAEEVADALERDWQS